ncbi:MAG TPA: hypothetical protein VF600_18030 [Abditibacteriaceae bacterium]|jgi:hypothetical protein
MRTQKLEKMLRQLPSPPAPDSLKGRCLATIPNYAVHNMASAKPEQLKKRQLRFAMVALIVAAAGIMFANTRQTEKRDATHNGNAVFAQTIEAMRRMPFFHLHGKTRSYSMENNSARLSQWGRIDEWFDVQQGWYHESRVPGSRDVRVLLLPNGTEYIALDFSHLGQPNRYSLDITSHRGMWEMMKSFANLPQLLGRSRANYFAEFTASHAGMWQERGVTVFTREDQLLKLPADVKMTNFTTKTSLYVEPQSHLPVAVRDWVKFSAKGAWQLTSEREFSFAKPKAALFNQERLVGGAEQIRRLVRGHHVLVKQSAWARANLSHRK